MTLILVILTAILIILTGILTIVTIVYTLDAKRSAEDSERYADESSKQLQNVSKITKSISILNQELLGWYKNPEPIISNWTNYGRFSSITILNYDSWLDFKDIWYPSYPWQPLSEASTEVIVYLWNSGRAPARDLSLDVYFEIEGYNENNPQYPYPVKIYSITTPVDYLGYIEYLNGRYINATMHGSVILATSVGNIEFLPEIDNATIYYPIDVDLGNIIPNDITSFSIKLFSMSKSVKGDMIIYIEDIDEKQLQKITIPLRSI